MHRFEHPEVAPPWPEGETRLSLDLGGEGLVRLSSAASSSPSTPQHRELPVPSRPFSLDVEIVARLPFGMPNRGARLASARLVWADVELERLLRRLTLAHDAGRGRGRRRPPRRR